MVGEPKYPPEQIYWILDRVLKKTKNDVLAQGFFETFAKALTPTQIRYIKNKYGKDPDFNSPMVNKRLEYRGKAPFTMPPGCVATPLRGGRSSIIPAETTTAAAAAGPSTTVCPNARPIPTIEQPFAPIYSHTQPFGGLYPPPGRLERPRGGGPPPYPIQANYPPPIPRLQPPPITSGPSRSVGGIQRAPVPSAPRVEMEQRSPLVQKESTEEDPTTGVKRDRSTPIETFSPPPAKRPKVEADLRPVPEATSSHSLPGDRSGETSAQDDVDTYVKHSSSSSGSDQGDVAKEEEGPYFLPTTNQAFYDPYHDPNAMPMMQSPSMYTRPFYNNTGALQQYSTFPGWRAINMAASSPLAIDPMLQTATHTSPQSHTLPLYSSRLPMAMPQTQVQPPPHIIPLPLEEISPSPDIRRPILNAATPLYPPVSPYISSLLQLEQGSIAPVDLMTTSQLSTTQEPASVDPATIIVQSPPILSSPEHDPTPPEGPEFTPPVFPTLDEATLNMSPRPPTPFADDDILQLSHAENETETRHDEVNVIDPEGFLFDLEPLVWATQEEEVGTAEAHQEGTLQDQAE